MKADAGRAPVVKPRRDEKDRRQQHAIESGSGTRDIGPAHEDRGPRDADDAGEERKVRQDAVRFAGRG